jgi:hypothetical protein
VCSFLTLSLSLSPEENTFNFYFYSPRNLHRTLSYDINSLEPGTGMRDLKYRWPRVENKIVVPFLIDFNARYSRLQIEKIYAAMRHISDRTCIKFQWRRDEESFLIIHSGRGCSSFIGRWDGDGGGQRLSLEKGSTCANQIGVIVHELVHSLGFIHMQSHGLRDSYITVIKENIVKGEEHQFMKFSPFEATGFGTPYDYFSIMHYNSFAYSRNGRPTIMAKSEKFNKVIGQMKKLSAGDVLRIRKMYNCGCVERGIEKCQQ